MSVLSLLKKVKVQTLSFEKHPCRELDQEMMVHYLNGLALLTNEDGSVCEKEQEYLSILINSFGLSEDMLETFVNFAQNPDEKRILDMMQSFMNKDIKYNFMIDAMMIASIDGNVHKNEKSVINEYFEMFKISKDEEKDLRYIYNLFYTQNGNALYRYFGKQDKYDTFLIKKELFEYLIDYYKIDMAYELKEDEKKVLDFEFFKPKFQGGSLGEGATEIMTKPVNHAQFCIYLNSAFLAKSIEIDGEGKVVDSETKNVLMDFESNHMVLKENVFDVDGVENKEKKITGITYVMAKNFIVWVSEYNNANYSLSDFNSHRDVSFNDFTYLPQYEFFYLTLNNKYEKIARTNHVTSHCSMRSSGVDSNRYSNISSSLCDNKSTFRMMKLPEKSN